MTISVLMVAEKPSICTSIAQALAKGQMETRGRTPPVHEFQGRFLDQAAFVRVTSVTGHVFSVDFPKQYQSWDSVDPIDLFDAPIQSVPEGKGGIVKHLEREAKGFDYLVLWLDCDREGENICFEVIRCVEKSMKRLGGHRQQIYRAKFSAVTPKDIQKAMTTLGEPNENESKAVEARQELDLKVGVAFSRFQTKYFQGKYGDLDSAVISYGPCQTPTLGFCVTRYDEIQSFVPEPFWNIDVSVDVGLNRIIALEWDRGRIFDQAIAETFMQIINQGSGIDGKSGESNFLKCTSVKSSETRKTRPQPMNTVEMLKLASSRLGIGPHAAMKVGESFDT
jgi:DNA topoisomerase-3